MVVKFESVFPVPYLTAYGLTYASSIPSSGALLSPRISDSFTSASSACSLVPFLHFSLRRTRENVGHCSHHTHIRSTRRHHRDMHISNSAQASLSCTITYRYRYAKDSYDFFIVSHQCKFQAPLNMGLLPGTKGRSLNSFCRATIHILRSPFSSMM